MLLPRKKMLAIVAVTDIALNARKRPVAAKTLAARHHLPPRLLEPVLQALVRQGILRGTRGPRGGYELARERRRITASDILRAARTVYSSRGIFGARGIASIFLRGRSMATPNASQPLAG